MVGTVSVSYYRHVHTAGTQGRLGEPNPLRGISKGIHRSGSVDVVDDKYRFEYSSLIAIPRALLVSRSDQLVSRTKGPYSGRLHGGARAQEIHDAKADPSSRQFISTQHKQCITRKVPFKGTGKRAVVYQSGVSNLHAFTSQTLRIASLRRHGCIHFSVTCCMALILETACLLIPMPRETLHRPEPTARVFVQQ